MGRSTLAHCQPGPQRARPSQSARELPNLVPCPHKRGSRLSAPPVTSQQFSHWQHRSICQPPKHPSILFPVFFPEKALRQPAHAYTLSMYRGPKCKQLRSQIREEQLRQECVCCAKSLQSCLTLCNPMDCRVPGSSVHGILQARILEWVALSFSRGIFLTQGSNPGLLHCRQILYPLTH